MASRQSVTEMMKINLERCTGCGACLNICPSGAITFAADNEGFLIPQVDEKCTDCGLCRRVCPYEEKNTEKKTDQKVFAAVHKDKEVLANSSSGGAFTALSDAVLALGGTVYGVCFDETFAVRYERAESKEERDRMRGSKYVQAYAADHFSKIAEDLMAGRVVLFTGTPCQVYGLKQYLTMKKVPQEKLLLIDNICHGPASPLVFSTYMEHIRANVLKGAKVEAFSMRSKKKRWQDQVLECVTEAGDESDVLNQSASWNKLYRTTYAIRTSCCSCPFTSYERVGDLTLGDFWNIENAGLSLDHSGGVSLILVNSGKGMDLLERCKKDLEICESSAKACWQIHLERPTERSPKREQFWADFHADRDKALQKYMKGSVVNSLARAVTPILRKTGLYTIAVRMYGALHHHGKK